MKWRKSICQLVLIFTPIVAQAQDNWVLISRAKTVVYEARVGSFERTLTEGTHEPLVTLTFRVRDSRNARIDFEKNYVRLADCEAGFGKLVTTDLNGRAKYDSDFVTDGGNVASTIADTLCQLARGDTRVQPSNITPRQRF
jgi:hypothetical protein